MNIFQKSISLFIAVMTVFAAQAKNYEVASPSGDLRAVVSVTNSGTTLSVFAGETEVLAPSPISLTIKERVSNKSFMGHEFQATQSSQEFCRRDDSGTCL